MLKGSGHPKGSGRGDQTLGEGGTPPREFLAAPCPTPHLWVPRLGTVTPTRAAVGTHGAIPQPGLCPGPWAGASVPAPAALGRPTPHVGASPPEAWGEVSPGRGAPENPLASPASVPAPRLPPPAFTSAPSLAAGGPAPAPSALSCACLCLGVPTPLVCRPQSHSLAPPAPTQRPVVKGGNRRPSAGPLSGEADARRALVERGSRLPFKQQLAQPVLPSPSPWPSVWPPASTPPTPPAEPSRGPQTPACPCPLVSACPVAGSRLLAGQKRMVGGLHEWV